MVILLDSENDQDGFNGSVPGAIGDRFRGKLPLQRTSFGGGN
jgi:hypothetical protein